MNKKFLALFLLSVIFLLIINSKFLILVLTGFFTETTISVSTSTTPAGSFTSFSYPSQVTLGCGIDDNNVTFSVVFRNTGNLDITETIGIFVKNSSLHTIASYYDTSNYLAPSESRNFSTNWTATVGSFWVVANASFNSSLQSNTTEESHSFEVIKLQSIGTLRRFPAEIKDTLPPGRRKTYASAILLWLEYACNGTNTTLNKTQGIPGDWVSFPQDRLYLVPNEVNSTNLNISIPFNTPQGVYSNGTIFVYAGNQSVQIGLNVTVGFIDFSLNTSVEQKSVCGGQSITSNINMTKILPLGPINVNMTYQIVDSNLTVYSEYKENNLSFSNQSLQKSITLTAPSSTRTGRYFFLTSLDYNSTSTQSYDYFDVISCQGEGAGGGGGTTGKIEKPIAGKKAELSLLLSLSTDVLTLITGNKTNFITYVKNNGTEAVKSVKLSIEGLPSEWIQISPNISDIPVGEVKQYIVSLSTPADATTWTYKLKVKAIDDVVSNTAILTLIVGRNQKEIAELLMKELETARIEAKKSLSAEDCINITDIKTLYQDAETAFAKGKNEYEKNNYEAAINWFEYALPIEKKVVNKVDITLELEVESLNKSKTISKSIIPPFYKPEYEYQLAGIYLEGKDYEKICDPILELKRLIFIGFFFWILIAILFIISTMIIMKLKRKRKDEYKETDVIVPSTT